MFVTIVKCSPEQPVTQSITEYHINGHYFRQFLYIPTLTSSPFAALGLSIPRIHQ